ncbi:MAG TPA: hypothetical protein VK810_05380 [Dongiaceae bacterium]|jgi:hypothetical protein|nr:hypothetical protein [Dongiaceae bacterium]
MNTAEKQEKEFIIPTRYKVEIGSYLSWPIGAEELTKSFLHVPQIKELQIRFWESYPKYSKGKWPVSFPVIEVQFSHPQILLSIPHSDWEFCVYPVPRNMRAEIREELLQNGLKSIEKWLFDHAKFSGRDGNLRFTGIWNSELKELTFGSRDYVLPEVSGRQTKGK